MHMNNVDAVMLTTAVDILLELGKAKNYGLFAARISSYLNSASPDAKPIIFIDIKIASSMFRSLDGHYSYWRNILKTIFPQIRVHLGVTLVAIADYDLVFAQNVALEAKHLAAPNFNSHTKPNEIITHSVDHQYELSKNKDSVVYCNSITAPFNGTFVTCEVLCCAVDMPTAINHYFTHKEAKCCSLKELTYIDPKSTTKEYIKQILDQPITEAGKRGKNIYLRTYLTTHMSRDIQSNSGFIPS